MEARAAQFAPFAALTGYDAVISETARLTDRQVSLDEERQQLLNRQFLLLLEHIAEHPTVTITYFVPDSQKSGGAYRTVVGRIRKYSEPDRTILLDSGDAVPLETVTKLTADCFEKNAL